jgi:hypothetical protein
MVFLSVKCVFSLDTGSKAGDRIQVQIQGVAYHSLQRSLLGFSNPTFWPFFDLMQPRATRSQVREVLKPATAHHSSISCNRIRL